MRLQMPRISKTSLLLFLLPVCVYAQDGGNAYVRVTSNLPGSLILVDSTFAGTVGDSTVISVRPGMHRIGVAPSEVGSWVLSPPENPVLAFEGDTVIVKLDFPITYRIDTVPYGATVFREDEDRMLGETPLVFSTDAVLRAALVLEKSGYATERIMPGTEVVNQHTVSLRPLEDDISRSDAEEWNPSPGGRWLTYSAVALIAAGGALAVHFKFEADDKYEEYLETADAETKAEVDRFDRMSYVALGGLQVGLGILVYRLAF